MFRGPIAEAIRQTVGAPIVHIVVYIICDQAIANYRNVSGRRDLPVSTHPVEELFSRAATDTQSPSLTRQRSRYRR